MGMRILNTLYIHFGVGKLSMSKLLLCLEDRRPEKQIEVAAKKMFGNSDSYIRIVDNQGHFFL